MPIIEALMYRDGNKIIRAILRRQFNLKAKAIETLSSKTIKNYWNGLA